MIRSINAIDTQGIAEAVFVLANPAPEAVTETVLLTDSKLMNMGQLRNLLDPAAAPVTITSALVTVTVAANSVLVLAPEVQPKAGYSPYKRVR